MNTPTQAIGRAKSCRILSDGDYELIDAMRRRRPVVGYVTTTAPIPMGSTDGKGPWGPNPQHIIPPGSTLKIIMVSSMGDFGLTDQMDAQFGYRVRLDWDDAAITNIRTEP